MNLSGFFNKRLYSTSNVEFTRARHFESVRNEHMICCIRNLRDVIYELQKVKVLCIVRLTSQRCLRFFHIERICDMDRRHRICSRVFGSIPQV